MWSAQLSCAIVGLDVSDKGIVFCCGYGIHVISTHDYVMPGMLGPSGGLCTDVKGGM